MGMEFPTVNHKKLPIVEEWKWVLVVKKLFIIDSFWERKSQVFLSSGVTLGIPTILQGRLKT